MWFQANIDSENVRVTNCDAANVSISSAASGSSSSSSAGINDVDNNKQITFTGYSLSNLF